MADDNVRHGIDDNPEGDAEKGAALGGLGGAVAGGVAGSAAGPVGTAVGAVGGGLAGAGASGAAVAGVDRVDNDNTVTGLGSSATTDVNTTDYDRDVVVNDDVAGSRVDTVGTTSVADDNIQHGIDDNPEHDAAKGAALGAAGGAAVGAAAGGPVGAVVGGVAGAVASGAAVGGVDRVDNDDTVTGLGDGATGDVEDQIADRTDRPDRV